MTVARHQEAGSLALLAREPAAILMQIDLNKNEIELIDLALDVWEKQALQESLISSMFGVMTRKTEEPKEKVAAEIKSEMADANKEAQRRRIKSIMLRAKLFQALSRESEHDLTST